MFRAAALAATVLVLVGCGGHKLAAYKVRTPQIEGMVSTWVQSQAEKKHFFFTNYATHCARTTGLQWSCFTDFLDGSTKHEASIDVVCDADTGQCIYTTKSEN